MEAPKREDIYEDFTLKEHPKSRRDYKLPDWFRSNNHVNTQFVNL